MRPCAAIILASCLLVFQVHGNETFEIRFQSLLTRHEANPTDDKTLRDLAILCYDEAGKGGNDDAVPHAEKYLTLLTSRHQTNAHYRVLLGSAITMRARPLVWPPARLKFANKGNAIMDEAVLMSPEDPQVRWVRAINNFHMPAIIGRRKLNRADFDWLWEQQLAATTKLPTLSRQEMAIAYGELLKDDDQDAGARTVWKLGLELDPLSEFAPKLRELLNDK